MTLGANLRTGKTVQLLYLVIAIIQRVGQMRCCPAGLTAANRAVIDDNYSASRTREEICSRHSGNAGSDHANARTGIAGKLW